MQQSDFKIFDFGRLLASGLSFRKPFGGWTCSATGAWRRPEVDLRPGTQKQHLPARPCGAILTASYNQGKERVSEAKKFEHLREK